MYIDVDYLKCTGCQMCEAVCSFKNTGLIGKSLSRIAVHKDERKGVFIPTLCRQCSEPKCIQACPTNAIFKEKETGIIKINKEECIGCRQCIDSCPFGAIGFDGEYPFKCEICGGDPECVKSCFIGALKLKKNTDVFTESHKKIDYESLAKEIRQE